MKKLVVGLLVMVLVGCDLLLTDSQRHYNKGIRYQETNQFALAEQQYKIALQKNPELAVAHLNLGALYFNKGWYDGAETSFKKAV